MSNAGVLDIIATVAIIAGGPIVGSNNSLDFLTEVAAEENPGGYGRRQVRAALGQSAEWSFVRGVR